MMLGQVKLGPRFNMAPETGLRFMSGIEDEASAPAPGFNMFAARTVTALTSRQTFKPGSLNLQPSMGARGKTAHVVGVAIDAPLVSHIDRPRDFEGFDHCGLEVSARDEQDTGNQEYQ